MAACGEESVRRFVPAPARGFGPSHSNLELFPSPQAMNFRICRCCGEPMSETGNALSRNPNICASCSSMADGIEDSTEVEESCLGLSREPAAPIAEALGRAELPDKAAEFAAQQVPK